HEAWRVHGLLDEEPLEEQQRKLVEWVKAHGGAVTVRQVQRGYRPLRGKEKAERALEELVRLGVGEWVEQATTETGGRPTRLFRLRCPAPTTDPQEGCVDTTGGFVDKTGGFVDKVSTHLNPYSTSTYDEKGGFRRHVDTIGGCGAAGRFWQTTSC
ncbi:MAG: hypothetical protein NZ703_11810, partial [Gemmataceae bacterium]|nr:hypothetical protein [Gemmataceae bacterium]